MSITDQVHTLARAEYMLLRNAAQAVDRRLAPVVDNSPGLSNALDRVRDVLRDFDDRVTGKDHPQPETRREEPTPAAAPAHTPAAPPTPAAEQVTSDPAPEPAPVEEDEVEELAEEYIEEETGHLTGELADNEDLRDVQARLRAKHTLQERDEQQH